MPVALNRSAFLVAVTGGWLLFSAKPVAAQTLPTLPPSAFELAGDRIEALTILGGDYGLSGGAYAIRGNGHFDLSVDKLGGGGDLGTTFPLGDGGMKWNWVVFGNLGGTSASGEAPGALVGNTVKVDTWAISLGGGARFWFNDHFSMSPTIGAMYGHTEQKFEALNSVGELYAPALKNAGWVDYTLETWTAIPSVDAKYQWTAGRINLFIQSIYKYYHTEDFNNSSAAVNIGGSSQTWTNTLDADIPLGWTVFGHELHTGGHLDALGLFGNVSSGLDTEHIYTANARLVVDMSKTFSFLSWLGVGGSYYWSGNVTGWSVGIDARVIL